MNSKKFWDIWGNLTYSIKILQLTALFEGLLIAILLASYIKLVNKKEIIVVPGAVSKMVVNPGEIPDEVVKNLALQIVELYASFHPASIINQINEILKFVSPTQYAKLKAEMLQEANDVIRATYSQIFYPGEVKIENTRNGGRKVSVYGHLRKLIGDKVVEEGNYEYIVNFSKTTPSQVNPYGLVISGLTYKSIGPEK